MATHSDIIRQFQHERAGLIDRLSRTRAVLAACKGHLEAEKLIAAKVLGRDFTPAQQARLDEINAILDEGLFGDGIGAKKEEVRS